MKGNKSQAMKHGDALLEKLAADISPQPPQSRLAWRYGGWLLAVVSATFLLGFALTRPGLAERATQSDFIVQVAFWAFVTLLAGASAFILATPRWPMPRFVKASTILLAIFITGYAGWLILRMPPAMQPDASDIACMVIVSAIGLLTAVSMVFVLKSRAKPTYPTLMAGMMATAGAAAGMLAILFVCPHEGALHVLISHFLPSLGMSGLLGWLGIRWWRW